MAIRISFIGTRPRAAVARCAAVACLAAVLGPSARSQTVVPTTTTGTTTTVKRSDAGFGDDLLPANVNGYYGLINQKGRLITDLDFDWTDDGYDGLARAMINGKTGFLIGNGDWRFDPVYDDIDRFAGGFAIFRGSDEKYGFIDRSGKVRHPPEFDEVLRFRENRAAVRVGDRCGYVDTRISLATPLRFSAARSFHDGFAAVRLADDTAGDEGETPIDPIGPIEPRSEPFGNKPMTEDVAGPGNEPAGADAADAESLGAWGFLNKANHLVWVDPTETIDELGDFNDNLVRFRVGDRWGYLDRRFRVVVEPTYEAARDFTNGVAAVKRDGKWGYIDRRYLVVVPFEYDEADDFDETLAMVRLGERWGFIDRTGRVAIEPQFEWAEPFRNGLARVARGDSFAYIRVTGYIFFDPVDAAENGIKDVTDRENRRRRLSETRPYNRVYHPAGPRPTLPRPYPAEHLYDEGIAVSP